MAQVSLEIQLQTFGEYPALASVISHPAPAALLCTSDNTCSAPGMLSVAESQSRSPPTKRTMIAVAALAGVNLLSSLSTGLLTVGLPRMALDVDLSQELLIW